MRLAARIERLERERGLACPACGRDAAEDEPARLEFVIDGAVSAPPQPDGCPRCGRGIVYRIVIE